MASSDTDVIERDNGLKEFFRSLESIGGQELKVGVFDPIASQEHPSGGITFGELAVIHEFGAPNANIPARSFFRSTIDNNSKKYLQMMEDNLNREFSRGLQTDFTAKFLAKLGSVVSKDMRKTIDAHIPPPLADGSGRTPLKDTGALRRAISFKVTRK